MYISWKLLLEASSPWIHGFAPVDGGCLDIANSLGALPAWKFLVLKPCLHAVLNVDTPRQVCDQEHPRPAPCRSSGKSSPPVWSTKLVRRAGASYIFGLRAKQRLKWIEL